jgi:hypothetical protein
MILRTPLHLLALLGLLLALGGQTARSQPNQQPLPAENQPSVAHRSATSATPNQRLIAATAAFTNTIYLSSIMKVTPSLDLDLSIDSLEITQAVQTTSNNVPLIAGRSAIVRVYAKYTGTAVPSSVTVSLTGTRGGVALPPVTLGPQAVSASPSRATYSSSFNLLLPASWLSGTVAMTATVDSAGTVAESDETNNTKTATLVFHSVPALDLVIVPILYTHTGPINPGIYSAPTKDTISDFIKRTYPLSTVNVTFHAPYNFTGDLGDTTGYYWGNDDSTGLLDQVTTLKDSEIGEASPKVYYGLVSTGTSLNDTWLPLNSGFILGIGMDEYASQRGVGYPSLVRTIGSRNYVRHRRA